MKRNLARCVHNKRPQIKHSHYSSLPKNKRRGFWLIFNLSYFVRVCVCVCPSSSLPFSWPCCAFILPSSCSSKKHHSENHFDGNAVADQQVHTALKNRRDEQAKSHLVRYTMYCYSVSVEASIGTIIGPLSFSICMFHTVALLAFGATNSNKLNWQANIVHGMTQFWWTMYKLCVKIIFCFLFPHPSPVRVRFVHQSYSQERSDLETCVNTKKIMNRNKRSDFNTGTNTHPATKNNLNGSWLLFDANFDLRHLRKTLHPLRVRWKLKQKSRTEKKRTTYSVSSHPILLFACCVFFSPPVFLWRIRVWTRERWSRNKLLFMLTIKYVLVICVCVRVFLDILSTKSFSNIFCFIAVEHRK